MVVAKTEYGFVVKSFGGVKGLLTFKEINSSKNSDLKEGSLVKTYVLFNKKKSGLALTDSKKRARKNIAEADVSAPTDTFESYLPTEEEAAKIKQNHARMVKNSSDPNLVGTLLMFRVTDEQHEHFFMLKSTEKSPKIAVLPKCSISSFGVNLPLDNPEFTFEGLIVE